jgi:uncharacterized protein
MGAPVRIGLISDTHGLVREEALAFLEGCGHIVHAGDICDASVLARLASLAPVSAVRGNNDRGDWAVAIPERRTIRIGNVAIHVVHDIAELAIDPVREGIGVVVFGHSHRPSIDTRDGVLHVNPGSAGPRRFSLPISAGELLIRDGQVTARLVTLVAPATTKEHA